MNKRIVLVIAPVLEPMMPFLSMAYLKAYLENYGYEVKIIDFNTAFPLENAKDICFWNNNDNCINYFKNKKVEFINFIKTEIINFKPVFVGFQVYGSTFYFVKELTKIIKELDVSIYNIVGGYAWYHDPLAIVEDQNIDLIALGEGEETVLEIAQNISLRKDLSCIRGTIYCRDKIIYNEPREEIKNIDLIPFPHFEDFRLEKYRLKNTIPMLFSRGCCWRCRFCTTFKTWKKYRTRTAKNIFEEILYRIKNNPEIDHFYLCDCAYNQDLKMLDELCDLLIENNIKVFFEGHAKIMNMNSFLLKKMRKAGFYSFNFGLESGSSKVLKLMGKPYTAEFAEKLIRDCYNMDYKIQINLVIGFPGETEEDFNETLNFVDRNRKYIEKVSSMNICILDKCIVKSFKDVVGYDNDWYIKDKSNTLEIREKRLQKLREILK
ncbi:MAG: B12-binding domain-containing radical SAM protein [Elusimicrobia bacterium]|nr:B12-binding domain-containing radical SAM protein [Elusimicrobiota bacterium]